MERVFHELASRQDGSLERELRKRQLLGTRGPNVVNIPAPPGDAIDLAYVLARLSIPPLRIAIEKHGGRIRVQGGIWWLVPPEMSEAETSTGVPGLPNETPAGIPLLAACSPEAIPAERDALDVAPR
jgi:hypothetical protein